MLWYNCQVETDFTETIVKDVLINGLNDEEINKEILGWVDVDTKTVEEALSFIEGKEMARHAMNSTYAGILFRNWGLHGV